MVRFAFHAKENHINIGIDLGTTNSAIAVHTNGFAQVCQIDGQSVYPSAIYLGKHGGMQHGMHAYLRLAKSPKNVASGFKRGLGTSWKFDFMGTETTMTAEQCSSEILRQLVVHAGTEFGDRDVAGAVITTPASFNHLQIEATKRAADMAGLFSAELLQEPIAAAMAVMESSDSKDTQFLLYDIGGGTLDLAIVSCVRGQIEIIGTKGDNLLGGQDFDKEITDNVVCPWLLDNFELPADFQALDRFVPLIRQSRFAAEIAKKHLSVKDETKIFASNDDLGIKDDNEEEIFLDSPISRAKYEELISDYVLDSVSLANELLIEQGYSSNDLDKVVFVGGPTKTPFLREMVSEKLGLPADKSIDPMTAVATGAAIYCEDRDWHPSKASSRKQSRAKQTFDGKVGMEIIHDVRVTVDKAKVMLRALDGVEAMNLKFQIASEGGWGSGLIALKKENFIKDIPVRKKGENKYQVQVVDLNHQPIESSTKEFVITRVPASLFAISAPHAVAIPVAEHVDADSDSFLDTIIKKGTHLPHEGTKSYRSRKDVGGSNNDEQFIIELFEQPDENINAIGEPNLFIGSCVIRAEDLEGDKIHKGDLVDILWNINESGLISAAVRISRLKKVFDLRNFYEFESAANQRNFGGKEGAEFVTKLAMEAKKESTATIKMVSASQRVLVRKLEKEIDEQLDAIIKNVDSDSHQQADKKIREIRKQLSSFRYDPNNKARALSVELGLQKGSFECVRKNVSKTIQKKFDDLVKQAEKAIDLEDPDAKRLLEALEDILDEVYYPSPEFQEIHFKYLVEHRAHAINREEFERHVRKGKKAINKKDFGQLKSINQEMRDNIDFPVDEKERKFTADIMHS